MEIKKQERIILKLRGYQKICQLVDRRVMDLKGYMGCEWCGRGDKMEYHHHHIVFRSKGRKDTIENLIYLCVDCHNEAHGVREKAMEITFKDCRMDTSPIKDWNERHKEEAERIYKRYAK